MINWLSAVGIYLSCEKKWKNKKKKWLVRKKVK